MTEANPLALVTGANRGIGKETARQLIGRGYRVLVGSRDAAAGAEAAGELGEGAEALHLDITDAGHIARAAGEMAARGQPLDLVVNNAAVALDGFNPDVARKTLDINVRGTVALADALAPRVREGGSMVFVSSGLGALSKYARPLRERFLSADRDGLAALAREFEASVASGTVREDGWPRSAYAVSKALVNGYVRVMAEELAPRTITVNAVCPGWVRTRMGGPVATRGVGKGARSVLAPAFDPDRPTGGVLRDGRSIGF